MSKDDRDTSFPKLAPVFCLFMVLGCVTARQAAGGVTPQRAVVVATLGIADTWKAAATNLGGKTSEALEFGVANAPVIDFKSPAIYAFLLAVVVITSLLFYLFISLLRDLNRSITNRQWSFGDALSEESIYQPKEVRQKSDVIILASSSRLIALLGLLGILTTVLGIGYSIMWNLFLYGTVPDLGPVRSFLFGAACLFAPYLANQVAGVFTPSGTPEVGEALPSAAITGVAPASLRSDAAPQVVSLTGTGFQPGLTVTLTDPQGVSHAVAAADIVSTHPTLVAARLALDTPGSWKVAVANPAAAPTSDYLFAVLGPPTITGIDPLPLTHDATVARQFTFAGTGFMSGLTVTLTGPHGPAAASINSVDSRHVTVTATLADAGPWHAVITNPGNYASQQYALQVN